MGAIFHELISRPLFNALVLLYQSVAFHDLGIAIILLTVVIRFILYPLFYKSFRQQTLMQKIQPEMKRIQDTHRGNKERQAQALMELYRTHKVNPFSGIFTLIIQLIILIPLYRVFFNGFSAEALVDLYPFISSPTDVNTYFLGLINLAEPNILIVGLAAISQYFQAKLSLPKTAPGAKEGETPTAKLGRQMVYLGPILTIVIFYRYPAAISLYWLATSLFSIVQQIFINRSHKEHGDGTISKQGTAPY